MDPKIAQAIGWIKYLGIGFALLLVGLIVVGGSYYTVEQNEVAAVTRFGQLTSNTPVAPGLHFKMPLIDTALKVKTSIDRISIPEVKIKTIDNQFVKIDVSLTYRTSDPIRTLFQVGDIGSGSVHDKLVPFVQSRTLDVFGKVNALEITDKKNLLEASILNAVQQQCIDLFGQRIEDVQITGINYDENFEKNIQITVQTRNQQLSAANLLQVKKIEADQSVAIAKGQADSAAAVAEGQKRVAIANAEALAQAVRLDADAKAYKVQQEAIAEAKAKQQIGDAEAAVVQEKIKAAGNAEAYAEILRSQALANWNGTVPQYQFGAGNGPSPVMVMPQSK